MKGALRHSAAVVALACLFALPVGAAQDDFDSAMSRGTAAMQNGDLAGAETAFRAALALRAGHPAAQAMLGNVLLDTGRVAEATELLEEAATAASQYYPARFGLGRAYLLAGNVGRALIHLRAAARLSPEDGTVQMLLASAELRNGNPGGALAAFTRAAELQPEDPGAAYGKALALVRLERIDEARSAVTGLLEQHPDHADGWFLLARLAERDAASAGIEGALMAAEFYREGLAHSPGEPAAVVGLARMYLALGLHGDGRELLAALPDDARSQSTAILRGRLAAGAREYEAAAAAYRAAIDQGGNGSAEAWYWLGVAEVNLQRPDEAAAAFRRAAELAPDFGAAWREQGKVALDANQTETATAALDRALELLPDDAETHYLRGMAYARAGETEAAITRLERAVELQPAHLEARYNLGVELRRSGETERSAALLAEVQEARRAASGAGDEELARRAGGILQQGVIRFRLGEPARALEQFDQVVELMPDNAPAHLYRAYSLADLQRFDEAAAAAERAAELAPERPDPWAALATIYERLGRTDDAARARARAAELSG